MRHIDIALVDDDEAFSHGMIGQINACLDAMGLRHRIRTFADPDHFLMEAGARHFDIVFLDIYFQKQNGAEQHGIELAKEIRTRDAQCQIVFLSASSDYAVHGYGMNAVGYLLKPIRPETLEPVLAECAARLKETKTRHVILKSGSEIVRVNAADIVHIEMKGRYVHVHGDKGELLNRFGKLEDIAPELPPEFVRIHQSYVVNIIRAASMKNYRLYMDNGVVLPISRPYRSETARAFFDSVAQEL